MIYLDSSALLKLVRSEEHSSELRAHLEADGGPFVTSVLAEVEVVLAACRLDDSLEGVASRVVEATERLELDAAIRGRAARYGPLGLRALDAIHVATAAHLAARTGHPVQVVTYDVRMARASAALGLDVSAPGRTAPTGQGVS